VADFDAFISHSWGGKEDGFPGHKRAVNIARALEKLKIKCWWDRDEAWDSLNE